MINRQPKRPNCRIETHAAECRCHLILTSDEKRLIRRGLDSVADFFSSIKPPTLAEQDAFDSLTRKVGWQRSDE